MVASAKREGASKSLELKDEVKLGKTPTPLHLVLDIPIFLLVGNNQTNPVLLAQQ